MAILILHTFWIIAIGRIYSIGRNKFNRRKKEISFQEDNPYTNHKNGTIYNIKYTVTPQPFAS